MALVAGVTSSFLQSLAATTLRASGTLAGANVFEGRDLPTGPALLPAIIVKVVREKCLSVGGPNGPFSYNTTVGLVVLARQVGNTPEAVCTDLLTMQEQVKSAFFGNISFNKYLQQVASIEIENVVSADGRQHTGEVGMQFELEVFQEYGPDDGAPLIDITGTITNPATGATRSIFDVHFPT